MPSIQLSMSFGKWVLTFLLYAVIIFAANQLVIHPAASVAKNLRTTLVSSILFLVFLLVYQWIRRRSK